MGADGAMQWIDRETLKRRQPAARLQLAQQAANDQPENAICQRALGEALEAVGDEEGAIAAYRRAVGLAPEEWSQRVALGRILARVGCIEDAHAALAPMPPSYPGGLVVRLSVLKTLGRTEEAIRICTMQMLRKHMHGNIAAEHVLENVARSGDGQSLLDACEALPGPYRLGPSGLAYRALALSLLGRADEAGAIIDLDRQVGRYAFEPPPEFGGIEVFNAILAEEMKAQFGKGLSRDRQGGVVDRAGTRAYAALYDWIKPCMENHIRRCRAEHYDPLLERTHPARVSLSGECFICRGDGHNGVHIHTRMMLAGVYYVQLPAGLVGEAGALKLGLPSKALAGHVPSWGVQTLRPSAGTLVLFPAYVFHDFIPTDLNEPRIAIGLGILPLESPGKPASDN
jgi:hypothetical protein